MHSETVKFEGSLVYALMVFFISSTDPNLSILMCKPVMSLS